MIPTSFGDLSTLRSLYLSNNRLDGTIPNRLGSSRLPLKELFLHGNFFTGTVPAALADLTNLEVLFIDDNKLTGTVPTELCAMSLNEIFFHNGADNVDATYSDLYGPSRRLQRESDPTSERDGCTSIACPPGYKSRGDAGDNKDGVFPCEPCEEEALNPYIGSNRCFDINQDHVITSLYEATNGPEWTGAQNWGDASVGTCEKEGITCNQYNQVTKIVLESKGLTGSLPAGIGFLDRLTKLDVSNNAIGGLLPADLRYAPLETLDVSDNQLTGYVPTGLCQKSGVNGNGYDGLFTCDIISCRAGYHASNGRADPGTTGELCKLCISGTSPVLGITDCVDQGPRSLTPFGLVGEIAIAIFGLTMIGVVVFVYRRSKVSTDYINDRAYFTHGPGKDEILQSGDEESSAPSEYEDEGSLMDPLGGMDGLGERGLPKLEVKVKDEWNGGRENKAQKEVWLDVPKIA